MSGKKSAGITVTVQVFEGKGSHAQIFLEDFESALYVKGVSYAHALNGTGRFKEMKFNKKVWIKRLN